LGFFFFAIAADKSCLKINHLRGPHLSRVFCHFGGVHFGLSICGPIGGIK